MDSEEDKKVKRIARFLELGGTMLAEQCNICGAPKFRYKGAVICPICDVKEESEVKDEENKKLPKHSSNSTEVRAPETRYSSEKNRPWYQATAKVPEKQLKNWFEPETPVKNTIESPAENPIPSAENKENLKRNTSVQAPEFEKDRNLLEGLLFKKLIGIAASLQNESDPRRIAEELDLIEKGLDLIKSLRQE